ncbi:hypothetical protein SDJN03_28191, partial [Cucurbita argyrosperma subsp. sororia]
MKEIFLLYCLFSFLKEKEIIDHTERYMRNPKVSSSGDGFSGTVGLLWTSLNHERVFVLEEPGSSLCLCLCCVYPCIESCTL